MALTALIHKCLGKAAGSGMYLLAVEMSALHTVRGIEAVLARKDPSGKEREAMKDAARLFRQAGAGCVFQHTDRFNGTDGSTLAQCLSALGFLFKFWERSRSLSPDFKEAEELISYLDRVSQTLNLDSFNNLSSDEIKALEYAKRFFGELEKYASSRYRSEFPVLGPRIRSFP